MRFTLSVIALAAIGAQAVPQVNPITQISDGQIQAPPATTEAPEAPTSGAPVETPVVPSVPEGTEVVPTAAPGTEAPSAPGTEVPTEVPSEAPTVVVPVPTGGANTTVAETTTAANGTITTGSPTSGGETGGETGGQSSPSSSETAVPEEGAASANMVSFGGLAVALFAMLA